MTLDEAIKHCEEVAEEYENIVEHGLKNAKVDRSGCLECASEHRQLAEWLRELKAYRIKHYKLALMDYQYDFDSEFKDNPMYYAHAVWTLFGELDASVEDEVMGYAEVNQNDK